MLFGALLAVGIAPGCYGNECAFGPIPFYRVDQQNWGSPSLGELITPNTWESTPIDAKWLDFPAESGWNIAVDRWIKEQRSIVEMHAYVSEDPHPNADGHNFAEGTGNIAEFSHASPGNVIVRNDTCAHYYVRVTLRAGPPMVDAGPD